MEEVRKTLSELMRIKTGQTPAGEESLSALKIDSLAMAELTMEIERMFAIKVDEDVLDVETVNDLVAYVYERQQSQTRAR
jgi:acyl carrier protein